MSEILGTIWVCTDCFLLHANGEHPENPDREPLSLIGPGYSVTLGLTADEHESWCDGDECACDHIEFWSAACQGCGSALAGERWALTLWAEHADYPHTPGTLYDCSACEAMGTLDAK